MTTLPRLGFLTCATLVALPPIAAGADTAVPRRIAELMIQRVRRSVAIGPFVAGAAQSESGGELDGAVGFGFDLSLFRVPIVPDIQEIVLAQIRSRLADAIARAAEGGAPLVGDALAATRHDIEEDVIAELLAERRPKLVERPRVRVLVELDRAARQGDWSGRLGVAVGVKPVSLGLAATTRVGDHTVFFVGPELSLQLLPGAGPRSPIIDVFVRADVPAAGTGEALYGLGVRAILDLI